MSIISILKIYRKILKVFTRIPQNVWFAYTRRHLRSRRKIIYALTPPPSLKNVGDHAQVVAIRAWLKKHFPEFPVIEVDKIQSKYFLLALQWLIQPGDVLFLQSGGNMGDRGIRSEHLRRLLISVFSKNQIISLPQSIQFTDTPTGRRERESTCRIYATHPNLTVIARDPVSDKIAQELFLKAQTFCMPDFVLSLPSKQCKESNNLPKVLLCLRVDSQSTLTAEQHREIAKNLPYQHIFVDTVTDTLIELSEQEGIVESTLAQFCASDAVVTDRFHGLVFAVLCKKPCVVLPTVDHKLTSGIHYFKDIPFVSLAQDLDEVTSLLENCLAVDNREVPDWNANYFDKIPKLVGLR